MIGPGEIGRRVWYLLNRARLERELRDEMAAHREMQTEDSPRFGNELRLREEAADQWGWAWFDRLAQDVRFGARLLRRAPSFSLTAVAVLALGIGVNLAAFEVFDAVALAPLPVRAPESLVNLSSRTTTGHSTAFSYPQFEFYRSRTASLARMFALVYGSVDLNGVPATPAEFVNAAYFTDLGVRPVIGRLFDADDERPAAVPVALLDEGVWRKRFGGDPGIVGRTLQVNGRPFLVAGVAPSSFIAFHGKVAMWIPVTQHAAAFTGSTLLADWSAKGAVQVYGRLRSGISIGAAQSELSALAAALHRERPADTPEGEWIEVAAAGKYLPLADVDGVLLALIFALVMLVFVTACTNLGVLILSRTLGRDREFGVRLAVGASRGRILRQLMTEHLMLGALGAAAGCGVAAVATRAFAATTDLPAGLAPHLNWRAIALAAACAVISAILFGLTPAFQAIRPSTSRRLRLRGALVAVQVAAAGVLLIVSGLLVRGVTRVARVDLGFDYQQTLLADPDLFAHGIKAAEATAYFRRVEARLRQTPGVTDAAVTTLPPFGNRVTINREGTLFLRVSPSYFSTLRIPLRRGRIFRDGERGVVLISESLARRRFATSDALGQQYSGDVVIGIVGTARTVKLGEASAGECYRPLDPADPYGTPFAALVVRASGPPHDVEAAVAGVVRAEGQGLTPTVRSMSDALQTTLDKPRQVVRVSMSLGLTALLLAVIGLGGLIACTVTQRQREIGIRVALGARPADVVSALARQFTLPVLSGAVGGSLLAAGAGTLLSSELFGVSQFDPLSHAGALLLFAIVAALAATPALRRALRVDPVTTLRAE